MGGGLSVQKTDAEKSEFVSYRDDFHKARDEGVSNREIFDKISKARVAVPGGDDVTPFNRQARTGSHQIFHQTGSKLLSNGLASFRRKSVLGVVSHDTKKHRRNPIFEDGFDFSSATARKEMAKMKGGVDRTKEVFRGGNEKLILEAMASLFFMGGEDCADQINALIDTMEKVVLPSGEWLMREGEPGDAMYVIKSGKLAVYVGGSLMRHVGRGNAVGELALLYHTPRSASIQAMETCELFCLHRTKFREMLALSVSTSLVQRLAWMQAIPELEPLDQESASRLAGAFSTVHLRQGEVVIAEGDTINRCFMVEHGTVEVTSLTTESPNLIEKLACPAFPRVGPSIGPPALKSCSPRYLAEGADTTEAKDASAVMSGSSKGMRYEGAPGEQGGEDSAVKEHRIRSSGLVLGPGVFLGMPVLLCAGKGKAETCWEAAAAVPKRDNKGGRAEDNAGEVQEFKGAISPVTITAREDLRLSYFTPSQFEIIVGGIGEVLSQQLRGQQSILKKATSQRFIDSVERRFTPNDFRTESFLGTGSFGRVTLVSFRDKKNQEAAGLGGVTCFALKALAKEAVVERGQLAHVKDEKLLLQNMKHPLIVELFSTFQDKNSIYLLLDAVSAAEMWSIIYEGTSGYPEGGLPIEHGRFYAACVLEALAYMHDRGVAYRDLKPENIMVDGEGYPRLIDLGFAKEIPFTLVVDGKPEVHPKSFTMCGTPEYLAPEFIFNTGHDKSVDCWALGILTYEFTAGYTPFQPPGAASDITALFTRIASFKSAAPDSAFLEGYDEKAKNKHSRDIVTRFLQADPSQRLGNLAGGMDEARKHPYFAGIDWSALPHKSMPAPWKPPRSIATPPVDGGSHSEVPIFTGDDSMFANW